jgi:hypothetical protein
MISLVSQDFLQWPIMTLAEQLEQTHGVCDFKLSLFLLICSDSIVDVLQSESELLCLLKQEAFLLDDISDLLEELLTTWILFDEHHDRGLHVLISAMKKFNEQEAQGIKGLLGQGIVTKMSHNDARQMEVVHEVLLLNTIMVILLESQKVSENARCKGSRLCRATIDRLI